MGYLSKASRFKRSQAKKNPGYKKRPKVKVTKQPAWKKYWKKI